MKYATIGLLLVIGVVCFAPHAEAQYTYVQTNGTYAPFYERNSGKILMTVPADEILSSWQTLPFPWTFYGESVTGYYASDNGYITFDSLATTSVSANAAIPDVTGPNKAIYAFWDALRLTTVGLTDKVQTYTYGKAPNRVHIIQWFSITPSISSTTLFFAIRLYECGDFDILLTFSNASGLSGTVGCENSDGTQATMVTGSPNHPGGGGSTSGVTTDDIVYHFYSNGQPAVDARLTNVHMPHGVPAGTDFTLSGSVENNGSATITSFDYSYSVDGGSVVTQNVSAISIPTGGAYTVTHGTPVLIASAGNHTIRAWLSNVNGGPNVECNDSLWALMAGTTGVSGTKRPLMEEFTGAWCQFCPDGKYLLDSLEAIYPEMVVASIHAGGGANYLMEIPSGVEIASAHCPFYPAGSIDRNHYDGEANVGFTRSLWHTRMADAFLAPAPVDLSVSTTYEQATGLLDVRVTGNFVDYAAGDLRMNIYITEDSVVGPNSIAYNQVNYYNTVPGHPYYGAGNPIVGYVHRNVLRLVPSGTWGEAGVLDESVAPGDSFDVSYDDIPINASWDADQVHVIAFVSYHDPDPMKRQVLNANKLRMYDGTVILGVGNGGSQPVAFGLLGNFPNPFNPSTVISYRLAVNSKATLKVYNLLGQEVKTLLNASQTAGIHQVTWDGKDDAGREVASGVYLYRLEANGRAMSRKMLLMK